MTMAWHDVLFAHWALPPKDVWKAVCNTCRWRHGEGGPPQGLELDTHDGWAWVGIVAFYMTRVGLRLVPSLGPAGEFAELNVRTYVRMRGPDGLMRPGVMFLSLDAASFTAVHAARAWFRLPYYHARIDCRRGGAGVEYNHVRTHQGAAPAAFQAGYAPGSAAATAAAPDTLEHWLIERYCLYAAEGGRCWRGEVHHKPWPFQPATAEFQINTLGHGHGLALAGRPQHLHYARGVEAIVWSPVQVR